MGRVYPLTAPRTSEVEVRDFNGRKFVTSSDVVAVKVYNPSSSCPSEVAGLFSTLDDAGKFGLTLIQPRLVSIKTHIVDVNGKRTNKELYVGTAIHWMNQALTEISALVNKEQYVEAVKYYTNFIEETGMLYERIYISTLPVFKAK